jgi:hypothetical protein
VVGHGPFWPLWPTVLLGADFDEPKNRLYTIKTVLVARSEA